jgi:hypothetical protein
MEVSTKSTVFEVKTLQFNGSGTAVICVKIVHLKYLSPISRHLLCNIILFLKSNTVTSEAVHIKRNLKGI